jgi:uncharacterized membrane protein YphA (DoxX/SURF4 family)
MENKYVQLFTRLAVATAFLSAVADRTGLWGAPDSKYASWGNRETFKVYSNQLIFLAPDLLKEPLAFPATILEVVFAVLLLIGYITKTTAQLSGLLPVLFAVTMTMAFGIKSTFTYSVWIGAGACFLLTNLETYYYSLDNYLKKVNYEPENQYSEVGA